MKNNGMKFPKPIQERRRAVRLDVELPFRIAHQDYEAEVVTINISHNGFCFRAEKDIPMMTKLNLGVSLPNSKKVIRVQGVVVRKEKDPRTGDFLLAAYISEIKATDQKTLEKFIQSRVRP